MMLRNNMTLDPNELEIFGKQYFNSFESQRQTSSESIAEIKAKKPRFNDIIGYDMVYAGWTKRYEKEKAANKIVNITNDIAINKQTIQAVGDSIYNKELGDLPDTDKDIREFSCDCGNVYGRLLEGTTCPVCGTKVKSQYNREIRRVGWINIFPYVIINPNAYEKLTKVIGNKNLPKILQYDIEVDIDGNLVPASDKIITKQGTVKQNIPFANLGMDGFKANFEAVLNYYGTSRNEMEMANHLIEHKDEIFSSYIPVSSLYLRPTFTSSKKRSVSFDKINATYIKILASAKLLRRKTKNNIESERAYNIVFDIQKYLQELYLQTIKTKISGKTKIIRGAILGNRTNFSSRMVIRSFTGVYCGVGKMEMSYKGFLELNLLEIINALMRGYADPKYTNMTVYQVWEYVTRAQYSDKIDPDIWKIMQLMLQKRPHNAVAVNRPPTLALGSIQCFDVVRITPNAKDKTAAIGLDTLQPLNADFDGDTLSFFSLKEKRVVEAFEDGLSPRRLIVDRTGDGAFNPEFGLIKDEYTSLISFLS